MNTDDPYLIGLLERDAENPAIGTFPLTVSSTAFDAVTRGDLIYWESGRTGTRSWSRDTVL